jgi:hypothetical protein
MKQEAVEPVCSGVLKSPVSVCWNSTKRQRSLLGSQRPVLPFSSSAYSLSSLAQSFPQAEALSYRSREVDKSAVPVCWKVLFLYAEIQQTNAAYLASADRSFRSSVYSFSTIPTSLLGSQRPVLPFSSSAYSLSSLAQSFPQAEALSHRSREVDESAVPVCWKVLLCAETQPTNAAYLASADRSSRSSVYSFSTMPTSLLGSRWPVLTFDSKTRELIRTSDWKDEKICVFWWARYWKKTV